MSKQLTEKNFKATVLKTAKIGLEGWKDTRVSAPKFYPKTNHYGMTVNVDSHVHIGKHGDYDSITIFGHRLVELMDLMNDLGFSLAMINQFDRIADCRVDEDGTEHSCLRDKNEIPRGLEISFNNSGSD